MSEIANCKKCSQQIQDQKYVSAVGFKYHITCFTCANCQKQFDSQGFYSKDSVQDKYYCKTCYFQTIGYKCGFCDQAIQDNFISAFNKFYHPEHFVCETCKNPIQESCFYKHNDKAYCKDDFLRLHNAICVGCNKFIVDKIFKANNKSWHSLCFKCQQCQKPFTDENYTQYQEQPYHESCFQDAFKLKCSVCGDKIESSYFQANEKLVHEGCFKCKQCKKLLENEKWTLVEANFACQNCSLKKEQPQQQDNQPTQPSSQKEVSESNKKVEKIENEKPNPEKKESDQQIQQTSSQTQEVQSSQQQVNTSANSSDEFTQSLLQANRRRSSIVSAAALRVQQSVINQRQQQKEDNSQAQQKEQTAQNQVTNLPPIQEEIKQTEIDKIVVPELQKSETTIDPISSQAQEQIFELNKGKRSESISEKFYTVEELTQGTLPKGVDPANKEL